jgi:hypothetical protein
MTARSRSLLDAALALNDQERGWLAEQLLEILRADEEMPPAEIDSLGDGRRLRGERSSIAVFSQVGKQSERGQQTARRDQVGIIHLESRNRDAPACCLCFQKSDRLQRPLKVFRPAVETRMKQRK